MNRTNLIPAILILGCTIFMGCENADILGQGAERAASTAPAPSRGTPGPTTDLQQELAQARAATARYRDFDAALEDGYVDIGVYVPGMGHHFLKPEYLDATFDIERPEILVYSQMHHHPGMRLVAVEYAVPLDLSDTPPEGFTGDGDVWHHNDPYGLWTLHAWIWFPNPDGVFAELNPRVP